MGVTCGGVQGLLARVVREGFSEEGTVALAQQGSGTSMLQAEGRTCAKALRWERAYMEEQKQAKVRQVAGRPSSLKARRGHLNFILSAAGNPSRGSDVIR